MIYRVNENAKNLCQLLNEKFPNGILKIVTAESCTAGLIAATIAEIPGSSRWLESGYVVYTPEAKISMLGVKPETIEQFNVTSENVASEMASGAANLLINRSDNNGNIVVSVGVTGVAGPTNDVPEIPVGTICIAFYVAQAGVGVMKEKEIKKTLHLIGDRNEVRKQVVDTVLQILTKIVNDL